jgi:aminopeptidase YwaD
MKYSARLLIYLLMFGGVKAFAQTLPDNDAMVVRSLRQHIRHLASDELEGRLVGSKGEEKASKYITAHFKKNKIGTKGIDRKYLQPFKLKRIAYDNKKTYCYYERFFRPGSSRIIYNIAYEKFYPLPFSGRGKVTAPVVYVGYGITAADTNVYDDYKYVGSVKGKAVVINLGYPEKKTAPEKYARYGNVGFKIDLAVSKGAAAIILVNNEDSTNEIPKFKPYMPLSTAQSLKSVPVVVFPAPNSLEDLSLVDVTISVETYEEEITGHNVIGFVNNNASNTVVIGAHYDHLGYNELGGSKHNRNRAEHPSVHNGADDNASGTAAMMELAKALSKSTYTNNNYLFVAFSAEEQGLLGSQFFVENLHADTAGINYMINLDMVGRLDTVKKSFSISGTGTSPGWEPALGSIQVNGLTPRYTRSGNGMSDHVSFYKINVPVLHYYTGSHFDHHRSSDDEWKINYTGTLSIIKHVYEVIGKLDAEQKLSFTPLTGDSSSVKVALGILPDYLYDGKGIKVAGLTYGRPGASAGLQKGDCIVGLGSIEIESIKAYANALGRFSKGDHTRVKVIREGKELEFDITF